MHVVIFEGSRWHTFAPISLSRPLFTLATGMGTLLDKQLHHLRPTRVTFWVRPEMESYCRERVVPSMAVPCAVNVPLDDEPALLVSARTVHFGRYEYPPHDAVSVDNGIVRSARVTMPGLTWEDCWNRTDRWLKILELPRMMDQSRMVDSLWELIHWNEESLIEDATRLQRSTGAKPAGPYHMVHEEDVWLSEGVSLQPGCVLDATKGPIVLADHVTIGANAVLHGPCYVGPHSVIRPLACIRNGTSIGEVCRVGGEVANSILLGFSNKSHDGFMGHSYVGKWVNLGAGTTTSNLKNTYGEISVEVAGKTVPTGWRFLGALMGDHVKTGILTKLTAGSYIGFGSMMAATAIAPKFTPSFTYWTDAKTERYRVDKVIEVAKRSFARRDRPWTPTDEALMRHVDATAAAIESAA